MKRRIQLRMLYRPSEPGGLRFRRDMRRKRHLTELSLARKYAQWAQKFFHLAQFPQDLPEVVEEMVTPEFSLKNLISGIENPW